jgi:hypothetical protein
MWSIILEANNLPSSTSVEAENEVDECWKFGLVSG